jgi:hypothetical protein
MRKKHLTAIVPREIVTGDVCSIGVQRLEMPREKQKMGDGTSWTPAFSRDHGHHRSRDLPNGSRRLGPLGAGKLNGLTYRLCLGRQVKLVRYPN